MKKQQFKPTIIEQKIDQNSATLLLQIDPEITYFEGHFSNFALLAGVAQIDWAIYYAQELLDCGSVFSGMEVIKFQQPILPGAQVLLTLNWVADKQKLHFAYTAAENAATSHSSGRIKLDAL